MDQPQKLAPPFLGNLVEICIVTRDHLRTINGLLRLGIGPFQIHTFSPKNITRHHYRNSPAPISPLTVCFAKHGALTWEIMQPLDGGPSIMAEFLSSHGEGIHHVAFDCDAVPVPRRKDEFAKRGFELVQEGIWHGKEGTCHFNFFDTEGAAATCFESFEFSEDWEDPGDAVWYPAPPSPPPPASAPAPTALFVAPAAQRLLSLSVAAAAIAADGARIVPLETGATGVVRAGRGASAYIAKGQSLKIVNTAGGQVVDFFAFALPHDFRPLAAPRLGYLSMQHTRTRNLRRDPKAGDVLCSNLRRPLLCFVEDSSPGVHDSLIPACDPERYRQLGVSGYHGSCAENLKIALAEAGVLDALFPEQDVLTSTPAPFNLFMNVSLADDGSMTFLPAESKAGDFVTFRAETDCLVVLSACPMDKTLSPINEPGDCAFEVL